MHTVFNRISVHFANRITGCLIKSLIIRLDTGIRCIPRKVSYSLMYDIFKIIPDMFYSCTIILHILPQRLHKTKLKSNYYQVPVTVSLVLLRSTFNRFFCSFSRAVHTDYLEAFIAEDVLIVPIDLVGHLGLKIDAFILHLCRTANQPANSYCMQQSSIIWTNGYLITIKTKIPLSLLL